MENNKRVALVTGTNQGIGFHVAKELGALGKRYYSLVIVK